MLLQYFISNIMHYYSSYALAKKASNQVQVDWVRSNKNYARGISQGPKGLFFACFKLGGTLQLNLCLLLHDVFRVLVLFRRMTQKLWKLLFNLHFNCIASTGTFFLFSLAMHYKARRTISFSVVQYQSSRLCCVMHFYQDFLQAVNKHRQSKELPYKDALNLVINFHDFRKAQICGGGEDCKIEGIKYRCFVCFSCGHLGQPVPVFLTTFCRMSVGSWSFSLVNFSEFDV